MCFSCSSDSIDADLLIVAKPCFVPPQQEKRIFTNFHRQLFCTIDKWVDLTMDDIRKMEADTQRELEEVSACIRRTG